MTSSAVQAWLAPYYRRQIEDHGGQIGADGLVSWPHHHGSLPVNIVEDTRRLARELAEGVTAGEKEIEHALQDFAARVIRGFETGAETRLNSGEHSQ